MITETLKALFLRDLNKLKKEIEAYQDEQKIWCAEKGITNPAGNLCLHLVGNLKHFVGKVLGNIEYERNRELEFSQRGISREVLVKEIEETIQAIETTLNALSEEQMAEDYPRVVFAEKTSTGYMLIHLATHLGYHLGQVNYHRRLLDTPNP